LNGNGNGHASFGEEEEEEAHSHPHGFFADQFEVSHVHPSHQQYMNVARSPQNRSNFDAHFTGTGPEIWRQTNGEATAFVAGAGVSSVVPSLSAV
jgi:cysteine synthase A